jgi:hypothetical protein
MEPVPSGAGTLFENDDCFCWDKSTDSEGDPAVCDSLLDRLTLDNANWVRVFVDRAAQMGWLRAISDPSVQDPPGFTLLNGGFGKHNEPVEPLPNWPALVVTEAPTNVNPTLPRTVTYSGGILWNRFSVNDPPGARTHLYCRNDHVVTVQLDPLP